MRIVLASRNENKLRELAGSLPNWDLHALTGVRMPPEEGQTYYENARAKALFGRANASAETWVLGEDSGLEVDGLSGRPGLHSARFAHGGEDAIKKLLRQLRGATAEERRARYVCELVCLSPGGDEFRGSGTLDGSIADEPRGSEGFGYDPVFIPAGETRTVAELGNDWKRSRSHRATAAKALREAIGAAGAEH